MLRNRKKSNRQQITSIQWVETTDDDNLTTRYFLGIFLLTCTTPKHKHITHVRVWLHQHHHASTMTSTYAKPRPACLMATHQYILQYIAYNISPKIQQFIVLRCLQCSYMRNCHSGYGMQGACRANRHRQRWPTYSTDQIEAAIHLRCILL